MRSISILLVCFVLTASALLSPAFAQKRAPLIRDEGMERMAEILGALHYLDNLCHDTSEEWRDFMDLLIMTENSAKPLRGRLIAAFNRSYRAFAENHHHCTPAAREAIKLYRQEKMVSCPVAAFTLE